MGTLEGRSALIFAAGPETEYGYIRAFLARHPQAYLVCADGGLRHARALGLTPHLVIGDFDSSSGVGGGETIRLRPEKDDTDTQSCMRELLRRGCRNFTVVCATGGRLDHLLANLSLLEEARDADAACTLLDRQNCVFLHKGGCQRFKKIEGYTYFSVVPLDAVLEGVTITGARYPLDNATVTRKQMITISNEATSAEFTVEIKSGVALMVFSSD